MAPVPRSGPSVRIFGQSVQAGAGAVLRELGLTGPALGRVLLPLGLLQLTGQPPGVLPGGPQLLLQLVDPALQLRPAVADVATRSSAARAASAASRAAARDWSRSV
ncbi:hypothetical protein A7K94_0216925, partial [Modestobacter sp. VKM Ac-2676]